MSSTAGASVITSASARGQGRAHLEALPGQLAAVEVHEHVAERLHVVATRLLDAEVRVDRRVPCRASQVLVFSTSTAHIRVHILTHYRDLRPTGLYID